MTWGIIGHKWAVTLLRQGLAAGRVAHAYLISGPAQVGKTTLALALAQALNCMQPDGPCGRCPSCRKIVQHVHPDFRLIVGEGVGGTVKIEQIRALQREAVLAPYEARHRILILRRMDLASLEAANSLLKILEEPPAHIVLVLTALDAQALPPTVVSRCQHLHLRPISLDLIETVLSERGVEPARAQLLSRLSAGRVGWALTASQTETALRQRQQGLDRFVGLLASDRLERLDFVQKSGYDLASARQQIETWISWWRDLLVLSGGGKGSLTNIDRFEELRSLAAQVNLAWVLAGMQALQTTAAQLEANVNTRLALERLLLELPRWQRSAISQT